ncbi:hypothetical protein [Phage f2b1]|nr:hypothetical protein [Phage f2b1]
MTKLTQREKLEQQKEGIRTAGYETFEVNTNPRWGEKNVGTMYIKEKMDYGFHVFFIHKPDADNPLAGVHGMLTEMYYDLRNRVYWIKRNNKEVNFSIRNVDTIFPKYSEATIELFNKLSTKNNQGLYQAAYNYLGKRGLEQTNMFGRFFHRLITEYSYFELLHKAGIRVTSGLPIVNAEGTSPREILGLSKSQWKMYNKYKLNIDTFYNYNNDKADSQLANYLAYVHKLEEEFGVDKIRDFVRHEKKWIYKGLQDNWSNSVIEVSGRYNLPVKKMIRYIYFECDVSQGLDAGVAIDHYRDYLRMVHEMEYERFDRYPKFLKTAHDVVARNHKVKLSAEELEQWNANVEKAKSFTYSYGDYKIITPEVPKDLVREGNVLGHCVGSYIKKVVRGTSTIMFLRDKLDETHPLVTVEIKGGAVTQARGKMNERPTVDQIQVVNRFAKKYELASPF